MFSVFILLHLQAYRKRTQLELNELELFDTRNSIQESGLNCCIAVLSICLAVFGGRYSGLSGPAYVLTAIVLTVNGTIMGRRRRALEKLAASDAQALNQ